MKCLLAALVLLLAATTCPAADDPLESLNTVEDTLNVMSQQRCNQEVQGSADASSSAPHYYGEGDDRGDGSASQQLTDDSCTSSAPDPAR